MDANDLLANMTLREALTEALDTWELSLLPLDRKVEILLDLFAAANPTREE